MELDKIVFKIRNSELDNEDILKYGKILITEFAKEYHKEQLRIGGVSFELPSDDIFDMPEVSLNNPLEEFYYYERPAYLEDDQKQFRESLQKALNYLKGN